MKESLGLLIFVSMLANPSAGFAQDQTPPQDGPNRVFHDELLDKMVGKWKLTGKIMGRTAYHTVEAAWVLNHQFLKIEEIDLADHPAGEVPYHAMVLVGYDNTSERYVAHWLDVFGGRFSETLGYGVRAGSEIKFVFEYPDGPFHTTFRWVSNEDSWQWLMETKDKHGKWAEFGTMSLTRPPKG